MQEENWVRVVHSRNCGEASEGSLCIREKEREREREFHFMSFSKTLKQGLKRCLWSCGRWEYSNAARPQNFLHSCDARREAKEKGLNSTSGWSERVMEKYSGPVCFGILQGNGKPASRSWTSGRRTQALERILWVTREIPDLKGAVGMRRNPHMDGKYTMRELTF
jgi:hypothetical protein